MNVDELLWDPWEVVWGSQQAGSRLDFELLRARGIFFKNLSIAEASPSSCSHFVVSWSLGIASVAVPSAASLPWPLVPSPGPPCVVLLCEETQGIMQLQNKVNAPSLWGYFPAGSISLAVWGYGYENEMWCQGWPLLARATLLLMVKHGLPPSFLKAWWLTKSRNWAVSN